MKRKILAIMLSSMLAFSFTACGNTEETADGTVTNAEADVDVADTGTDVENDAAENDAADIVVDTEAADAQREESEKTKSVMKIYSINMSSGEIQTEDVETDSTEDLFCLLDVPILEMPDLAGTTWSFCGGNLGGVQMTQDDYDAALEQYGGKLEIVFSDDGSTVQMVQGGGTLDGVCEYHYEDEGVRLTFDNNGTDLVYACVFADFDGLTMVALSDTSGYNAVYFVQ